MVLVEVGEAVIKEDWRIDIVGDVEGQNANVRLSAQP
jgi:hypothetical protein